MSRFLIGTMPYTGHVLPALPVARKLVEQGHEVGWYTGKKFQSRIEATGARFFPMVAGHDYDDAAVNQVFPERGKLTGLNQVKFDMKHVFIDPVAGHLQDLEDILRDFPADVLIGDTGFVAGKILYERGRVAWAVFNITVLGINSRDTAPFGLGILPNSSAIGRIRNRFLYWTAEKVVLRDVYNYFKDQRQKHGWRATEKDEIPSVSPYLYLQPSVPGFEYPRSDLPRQVHFVGPLLPPMPKEFVPPVWWREVTEATKPVILVTQGTLATESDQLIAPTLQGLANEDVLVVAVTGGRPVESLNIDIPANARVETFIPFGHLMPYVTVMVTNGGYGGVTTALQHGVPLVVGGVTEDKAEVSNRVAYSGVGINLKTATPTPEQVRAAVREVLSNRRYRHNAQGMRAEFEEYDAPTEAALLLEKLAATQQPVYERRSPAGESWREVVPSHLQG